MANRQMARLFLVDMIQDAHFSHNEENPQVQGTVPAFPRQDSAANPGNFH